MLITATLTVDDYIAAHRLVQRRRHPLAHLFRGILSERLARQAYGETLAFSRPFTFTWDAQAIQGLGANSVGRCRWDELVRFEECEKVMVLFLDEELWQAYAKRWFTEPSALEDFRARASRAGRPGPGHK